MPEPENISRLTHITKCILTKAGDQNGGPRIPCTFTYTDHQMDQVELIGQPQGRFMRLLDELTKHLQKKHRDQFDIGMHTIMNFTRWLVLRGFETQDPRVLEYKFGVGFGLRRMLTGGPPISDDDIEVFIGKLNLTEADPVRANVRLALRNMRDYYEGKLAIQNGSSPESPLIRP